MKEMGACSPYGTRYLLDQGLLHGDAVIVGEPGNDKIANAHRGLYRFRIQTRGKQRIQGSKHGNKEHEVTTPFFDMARIALALSECSLPIQNSDAFPGRKSVLTFPTKIEGGIGFNSVPDRCEAYGEVRLLPGLAADEVRSIIGEYLKGLPIKNYRLDDLICIPAVETNQGAEIVQALASIIQEISG